MTSPTQPFPLLPEPFTPTVLTRDDLFGLTPLDRRWCRRQYVVIVAGGNRRTFTEEGDTLVAFALGE